MLELMSWFYLALLAPFLYAIVNLLDDNLLSFVYKSPYLATSFAGIYGALPLVAIFFKAPHIPMSLALLSMLAGLTFIGFCFFYFKGLQSSSPSVVVAILSLSPAAIPFFAHYILHEDLKIQEILGLSLVLLASFGLTVTDIRRLKFSSALLPALLAAGFTVAEALLTKYVYQRVHFYPAYMFFSAGVGLGGVAFLCLKLNDNIESLRTIRKSIKKVLPFFILNESLAVAAGFTLNLAVSRGPVSLVKVAEGIQPMFVLLIALTLHPVKPKFFREAGEGKLVRKFALMSLAIVGLAVIGLAYKA